MYFTSPSYLEIWDPPGQALFVPEDGSRDGFRNVLLR